MSNLFRNLASRGGISFAHLGKGAARAADDTPPPDDKGKKSKSADDGDQGDQTGDDGDSDGARGESGDDGAGDDGGDSGSGSSRGKKSKRASDDTGDKDAEDDDDDEDEMRGNSAAAAARRRERARCATIMGSPAAGKNPVLAANLAFNTSMTRKEALAVITGAPAPAASAPTARRNPQLGAGGERGVSSQEATAASWDVAMKKARPSRGR